MTAEQFYISESGFGENVQLGIPACPMTHEGLFVLMQAYADHCNESAWVDANERLPERYEGYPLTRNCLLFDGKEYLFGFYSYAHSQWESDEFAPLERITHWRPLPAPPKKIPANAPQTPQEEES